MSARPGARSDATGGRRGRGSERRGAGSGAIEGRRGRGAVARAGAGPNGAGQGALLLETPRLTLREFTAGDFDDLLRLDSDPRVMRYIGAAGRRRPTRSPPR